MDRNGHGQGHSAVVLLKVVRPRRETLESARSRSNVSLRMPEVLTRTQHVQVQAMAQIESNIYFHQFLHGRVPSVLKHAQYCIKHPKLKRLVDEQESLLDHHRDDENAISKYESQWTSFQKLIGLDRMSVLKSPKVDAILLKAEEASAEYGRLLRPGQSSIGLRTESDCVIVLDEEIAFLELLQAALRHTKHQPDVYLLHSQLPVLQGKMNLRRVARATVPTVLLATYSAVSAGVKPVRSTFVIRSGPILDKSLEHQAMEEIRKACIHGANELMRDSIIDVEIRAENSRVDKYLSALRFSSEDVE